MRLSEGSAARGARRRGSGSRRRTRTGMGAPQRRARDLRSARRPRRRARFARNARRTLLVCALLAAAGLVVAAGVIGGRWAVAHPALAVRQVVVTGTEKASATEIAALAGIVPGEPWLKLDLESARLRVRTHPWVEDVRVFRPSPGTVRLDVREFEPIAAVEVAGSLYGLTRELTIVPEAGEDGLPLIAGAFVKGRQDAGALNELLARGIAYVRALSSLGFLEGRHVELVVRPDAPDRIRLEGGAFTAVVEGVIPPPRVARNVAAFLENLDAPGEVRGTLRLVSPATAVWQAAKG